MVVEAINNGLVLTVWHNTEGGLCTFAFKPSSLDEIE